MTVTSEPDPSTTYVAQGPSRVRLRRRVVRERPLLWICAAVVVIGILAFVSAPLLTYRAIRSAARYDDTAALATLVDYDLVRASLRPQLIDPVGVRAAPPPPNPLTNPLAALERMWGGRSWSPAVRQAPTPDAYLSPVAMLQVIAGDGDPRHPPQLRGPVSQLAIPLPSVAYFGARRVRLVVRNGADHRLETVLTLARGKPWFDWKLVGIGLPDPQIPAAALKS